MEWTELLNYIFGGTSLIGLATTVILWNKSRRKEGVETQKINGIAIENVKTWTKCVLCWR